MGRMRLPLPVTFRGSGWFLATSLLILCLSGLGCERNNPLSTPVAGESGISEPAHWEGLPLPADAGGVEAESDSVLRFTTTMIEPDLFEYYSDQLAPLGWEIQAPTEAMESLPHRRWRRQGIDLTIEIRGMDEHDRTIVWAIFDEGVPDP